MEVPKTPIEILLDHLDESANSNTAWLDFSSHSETLDLQRFLLNQLKSGYFHFQLLQSDINRGWEHYVEINLSARWKNSILILPKPGNTWNGNTDLSFKQITIEEAKSYIVDLLTNEGRFFSKNIYSKGFSADLASDIFNNFVEELKRNQQQEIIFYNIEPNFLSTIEEYHESDSTKLGYFEDCGRDFVLGIFNPHSTQFNLLMLNGYP